MEFFWPKGPVGTYVTQHNLVTFLQLDALEIAVNNVMMDYQSFPGAKPAWWTTMTGYNTSAF